MYFTLQELLEGIFVHVGLHKLDWLDRDTITDLMTACATWPKEGDAIQEAARLTAQVEIHTEPHQGMPAPSPS